MKKAIKKITAIGAGAMLLGTSLLGASASLEDFPAPFVADGVADVQFVIGSGATDDYLGVLDIATTLQAAAVSEETVATPGASVETSIDGGYVIGTDSDPLLLGEVITSVEDRLTDSDLPNLLADGTVEDDDGDEFEYTQELKLGGANVTYGTENTDLDDPTLYLDLENIAEGFLWNYTLDFSGEAANFSALDDSESIVMFGKSFTVDADSTNTGDITLYGSDTTTLLDLNAPVTVEVDGSSYTVEVVGADSDGDSNNVILDVNGDRKTIQEGFSGKIGGIDIYLEDLFVTNIPTLSASANVFIGSNEVVLKSGGSVEIDSETVAGLTTARTYDSNNDVDTISILFNPEDLSDDVEGFPETEYLMSGDSVIDPMFGTVSYTFAGGSSEPMAESKTQVHIVENGEDLEVTFTSDDGDAVTFVPYSISSSDVLNYEFVTEPDKGFNGSDQNLSKDQVFILNEQNGQQTTSYVFEVESFTTDNSVEKVTIKNLNKGTSREYEAGDEFEDTGVTVSDMDDDGEWVRLNALSSSTLYVEGGYHNLVLGVPTNMSGATNDTVSITFNENTNGVDDADEDTMTINVTVDIADDEVKVNVVEASWQSGATDDNDNKYYLSDFGTFADEEEDDNDYVKLYIPQDEDAEVTYQAFIASEGATVSTVGGSGSVTTQMVNPIGLGIAVRDVDVNVANPAKNLIVVGGTCINSVAATLKGVAAGTCGTESGLNPDEAIIELFDLDNGKVAMLVAGWEATETQAAARAVASEDSGLTGDSATLTVTSATNYQIQ